MKTKTGLCVTMAFFLLAALALAGLPAAAQAAPGPEDAARSAPLVRETISAGARHTCAIRTDGTVACWGLNDDGQATPPPGAFTQVSAGGAHTCGLRSDGTVACWGCNLEGQSEPPGGTFLQVSAGGVHTCGVRTDGTLACWGYNDSGQSAPPAGIFAQVSAGGSVSCGLRSNGTVNCWGRQYDQTKPAYAPAGTFRQVSAGAYHACGIKTNGTAYCWMLNRVGDHFLEGLPPEGTFAQVDAGAYNGCGLKTDGTLVCWGGPVYPTPTPVPEGTFTRVTAGMFQACGLRSDGTLACWGDNTFNQATPPEGSFGQQQVTAGAGYACGLKADGTLACSGDNESGKATPPVGSFTQVSADMNHACGLGANGSVACWGNNEYGKATPPGGTFLQVSAGNQHSCGIRADGTLDDGSPAYGTLACWGDNSYGQTNAPEGSFVQVSAGWQHSCGLKADGTLADGSSAYGTLACWGDNSSGQTNAPPGAFRQVSAGGGHSCGIKDNGTLVCWGNNSWGQSTPPAGIFTQVSAGARNTCALRVDGTVACWGYTPWGVTTPPQGTFVQVSVGFGTACGVRSDGMIVCWGARNQMPFAPVEAAYSQALTIFGGTSPYTFDLVSGSLPPGLELSAGGLVSGTPTEVGAYDFTVQVSDDDGPLATLNYSLDVMNVPAYVTTDPIGVTVAEGSGATFTAAAGGAPVPTVQWEVSADGGTTWTALDGATATELAFAASLEQNGNQYRAVFTNVANSATTNAAVLTVTAVPPTVTLSGPAEANEGETKSYSFTSSDPGGGPFSVSAQGCGANGALSNAAFDPVTGAGSFDCTFPDGPASSTVSVQVQDRAEAASDVQSIEVTVDNLAPVVGTVAVSDEPSIKGSPAVASATFSDANTNDGPFTCTADYGDGSGSVPGTVEGMTCTGPAHTYNTVGSYTVVVAVSDKDGGTGTANAVHAVHYAFSGFFPPVDNPPVVNVANAGRSIPVKFSLGGNQGLGILMQGSPQVRTRACGSEPGDAIESYSQGSGLSYDPGAQQYTYVWATQKSWAGKCVTFLMVLVDGTLHTAEFQFK